MPKALRNGDTGLVLLLPGAHAVTDHQHSGLHRHVKAVLPIALAALLLQQPDARDHHALVDGLEHVVDGERGHTGTVHGLHLHAGAVDGAHPHGDDDLLPANSEGALRMFDGQRMAVGDRLVCPLHPEEGRHPGALQHITLGHTLFQNCDDRRRIAHGHQDRGRGLAQGGGACG